MSGVDLHGDDLSREQGTVVAPSVQDSQSSSDEKGTTDLKNATECCKQTAVNEEIQGKESTEVQMVTVQSLQLVRDRGQYQIDWRLTVIDASRLFVDVVCYGTLNCYSRILLKFLRACEKASGHRCRSNAIEEIRDASEEENKTTEGVLQCQEAEDEIDSLSYFAINPAFTSLDTLRRDELLCDVELSVGDHRSIAAHKVVLAAVIPYFKGMFATEMLELKKRKIVIHNLEYEMLDLFVSYAYSGRLHLDAKNVLKVMFAANFFQLDNVTEKCGEYLRRRLHPSNMLSIRAYCSALNCSSVLEATGRFIEKYFMLVCRSEEFLQASVDDLVNHDLDERKVFASRVFACVRLEAMNPSFLAVTVGRHPLIRDDPKCRELVDTAKDYHLVHAEHSSLPSQDANPRVCHDLPCIILAIGGRSNEDTALNNVEKYDPFTRQWVPVLPMTSGRSDVGVAVYDRKVYVFGGRTEYSLQQVERFDYTSSSWTQVAGMPQVRDGVSAVFLGDKLYVIGGQSVDGVLNTVKVFYPVENIWSSGVPMSTRRTGAAVAVLDGYIYVSVMGGSDGHSALSSVERYLPDNQQWEKVAAMQSQRSQCAAAVLNGRIYVCGGTNGSEDSNSVECFDPKVNRWFSVAPMKVVRSGLSVVAYDNAIYAIAGKNDFSALASMEVYHEDTNEWEFAAYLTSARSCFGAVVVPTSLAIWLLDERRLFSLRAAVKSLIYPVDLIVQP
ncbi:hypothetical protein Aduo_010502 [Ancylostoma duodenale]